MFETYTKHWDNEVGFTMDEALTKKRKVDEAHEAGLPGSRWKAAEIVIDPDKRVGYKIIIRTA